MNTTTIKGHWNVAKGKLKQQYAELTDNDLTYVEGKEDELLGRIQQRTGRAREEIESYLTDECGMRFDRRVAPGETAPPSRPGDVRR